MFRKIVKYSQEITLKPLLLWYLRKDRSFNFEGLNITVKAGIFHPLYFYSSLILVRYLKNQNLLNKKLLEPGCGSGLISVWAAAKGAKVTALDINPEAVANTLWNAENNNLVIKVIESNLYSNLPPEPFDFILINPPYYPGKPLNNSQYAWYCGPEFEFFETLFGKLSKYIHLETETILVLSQDCDLERIKFIAGKYNFDMQLLSVSRSLLESNFLFKIKSADH